VAVSVAAGFFLASGCFGPGTALGVGAVSRDLLFGRQGLVLLSLITGLLRRNSVGFGAPLDCLPQMAASACTITVHSVKN
jgi:hypothetical protein